MKNKIKNMKGITLVALIITIIVLLILAGVVINMTLGNDGIISKAQGAVDMYKNAQEKEEWELAKAENSINNYSRGTVTISEELYNKLIEATTVTNVPFTVNNSVTGLTATSNIKKNGRVISGYIRFDLANDLTTGWNYQKIGEINSQFAPDINMHVIGYYGNQKPIEIYIGSSGGIEVRSPDVTLGAATWFTVEFSYIKNPTV